MGGETGGAAASQARPVMAQLIMPPAPRAVAQQPQLPIAPARPVMAQLMPPAPSAVAVDCASPESGSTQLMLRVISSLSCRLRQPGR